MSIVKKLVKFIFITSLATIALCLFLLTYFFYFIATPDPSENLLKKGCLKNKNAAEVKILETESDLLFFRHDVEIKTKDGYTIILYNVRWTLNNRGIYIPQINDIKSLGGRTFELKKGEKDENVYYVPNEISILGKMLGIKLKSVDDIINNIEQLYGLYEFLETKSRTTFIYKDKFEVAADFKRVDMELE